MKQAQFEAQHAPLWDRIATVLDDKGAKDGERADLPALYRRLCQCHALAEQRGYSSALVSYLRHLVTRCHRLLYGTVPERPATLLAWLRHDLPRGVRAEWRLLLLVLLAFWGTAAVIAAMVWYEPARAYLFLTPAKLAEMQKMYQPGAVRTGRGSEGDVMMFGFYIWNNVSIGFRTFAGGIAGGVPALASLVYNGINLGVVAMWLSMDPGTRSTFWPFVITHASVEVTGLLLSALAGIRLGLTLIRPGRMTRRHALHVTAQQVYPLVAGAALLTVLAAFIEAFWSAHTGIPAAVRVGVGAGCWLLVLLFFGFAGRDKR